LWTEVPRRYGPARRYNLCSQSFKTLLICATGDTLLGASPSCSARQLLPQ
jgi:hypothetical protein